MIYWRCTKCDFVEVTSPYVVDLRHTHMLSDGNGGIFSLLACRSMAEAKAYKVVRRKGRFGLRMPVGK